MSRSINVTFRVDASLEVGNGHVMRCLALARALADRGASCKFVCAALHGNLVDLINSNGFESDLLAHTEKFDWRADSSGTVAAIGDDSPDWLIVDHYRVDQRWEAGVQPFCARIMVIDDLADRIHACDMLLDQNLGRTADDYHGLVAAETRLLTGPGFALLRPEFSRLREFSLARRQEPRLRNILISMGGTDSTNATSRLLGALENWNGSRECRVVVVLGPNSPWGKAVRTQAANVQYDCLVFQDPPDYATLLAECDLCIGTAGISSWERCCLGVPSIVASVADNQIRLANQLVSAGAALGRLDLENLEETFGQMMDSATLADRLSHASRVAATLCSGHGSELVANGLLEPCK